ncbi:hypothetical protein [Clostridium botulinum]|uniref:Uncharacterized protein n=2 Tax=Clostridium botulinum TaxID=1491 RepID=A0A9Q1ZAR5_CLOBO|nr:hypothetical protein [Clostridium botulinum]AEB77427.1 hypothetical protein CbC4_5005 [Clostridium botulinum BKT015925]KEH96025.1 hypothetical protein Y848_p0005 [Clostridium botulinum C/D str. Sp77]KLU74601.1 hypothetical protein CBC3_12945 [Clostridium botulinum V891]KOA75855.1 hypothetical protein ADU77_10375 [Clostridium botulinum]KOA78228.1 hypothetical protein ADU78_02145 [Clostridium botulinum]
MIKRTFGKFIDDKLVEKNISRREVARTLGFAQKTFNDKIQKNTFRADDVFKLAHYLCLKLDEIKEHIDY